MKKIQQQPIGIFDSGVGGLSIADGIRQLLPAEDMLYIADQEFAPYGNKSKQHIDERCSQLTRHLYHQGCKAVVVACNTATVNSIAQLREQFAIPIIGVEPGIKPAAKNSVTCVVGVLATQQTLNSESFKALLNRVAGSVQVILQASPKLVSLVEAGELEGSAVRAAIEEYLKPLLQNNADQIVLGCTHYSFLKTAITAAVQGHAKVLDTPIPVANELKRRLSTADLLNEQDTDGRLNFYSTQVLPDTEQIASRLWGQDVSVLAVNTEDLQ